ncbi:MAG: CRISPR-associated RAMP protein Csx7 [Candidatus Caldarchaeum sp.]
MTYPWYTHIVLQRLLKIDLSVINESPLRIGSGKAPPLRAVDLPIITVRLPGGDTAYIPGSSLKGVIRSTCELIAKSSRIQGICEAGQCGNKYLDSTGDITYHKALDRALRANNVRDAQEILARYCLVCKTFGSSSFGSHVDFQDLYPTSRVALGVKSGIAINRRSGAVRRGALYEAEYIEPGHEFAGSVTVRNLPNYLLGLILLSLDYLNSGMVKLGGFKSRGFGEVAVKITKIDGYTLEWETGPLLPLSDVTTLKGLDELDEDVAFDLTDIHQTLNNLKKRWFEYVQAARRGPPG